MNPLESKVLKATIAMVFILTLLAGQVIALSFLVPVPSSPTTPPTLPPPTEDCYAHQVIPKLSVESSAPNWAVVDASRKRVTVYQESDSSLMGFALGVTVSVQECQYGSGTFYTKSLNGNASLPVIWATTSGGENNYIGFSSRYVILPPDTDSAFGFGVFEGSVSFIVQVNFKPSKYTSECSADANAYQVGEFGIFGRPIWTDPSAPTYNDVWSLIVDFGGCK